MRLCFICETPLHVLNSVNYVANQEEFSDAQVDFYIGRRFYDSENVADRLRRSGIVHNVYTYSMDKKNIALPARIKAIFLKKSFIADCIDGPFNSKVLNYDYVHFAFFGPMPYAMVFANKRAKVRYFEDGLGTYVGTSATEDFSLLRKTLYTLTGTDYTRLFKPEVLFVNNKAMCASHVTEDIRQLPLFACMTPALREQLYYIFGYQKNPVYTERKCVYLSRPNDFGPASVDVLDRKIENVLSHFSDDFVLRMHPRQSAFAVGQMQPDTSRNSWELMCIDEITEDHILVGWFSTAQVVPKFILDKEPWLVFYYPIYQRNADTESDVYASFDQLVDRLKKSYRAPEKIVTVGAIESLPAALASVIEEANNK